MRRNKLLALTALAALLIAMTLSTPGCGAGRQVAFNPSEAEDFSKMGWVDAFDS